MKKVIAGLVMVLVLSSAAYAQRGGGRGRDSGPKVGEKAPDFELKVLSKKDKVKLSKIVKKNKKPVVLIFGSYT